jgi:predicted NUDIX family NTP pyrophosphohydrolase
VSRASQSAGILVYRRTAAGLEVLLIHPGGPYWKNKDANAWSIPKGLLEPGEDPRTAAVREFAEETGTQLEGALQALGSAKQPSGKTIHAFTAEADIDADAVVSNTFEMEWPPNSGTVTQFPEVDAAAWFALDVAREKIIKGQLPFVDRLAFLLEGQ